MTLPSWLRAPSQLARGTAVVAAGAVAGQIAVLVATPFLARAFGPALMGSYAAFAAIASILVAVACLKYEVEIPNASEDDYAAVALLALLASVAFAALCAVATYALVACCEGPVRAATGAPGLLPVVVLLGGVAQAGTYLAIRLGRLAPSALYRLLNPIVFVAAALAAPQLGLPGAHVLGLAACVLFLWLYRRLIGTGVGAALRCLGKLRQAPARLLPAALMDAAAVALPVVFIGAVYGAAEAGHFSQVQRLIVGPLLILAIGASQAILAESSRRVRAQEALGDLLRHALVLLGATAVTWLAVVTLGGAYAMEALLGPGWRTDRAFVLVILCAGLMRFVASPASAMLLALGRFRMLFLWQAALFAWVVAVLPLAAARLGFETFLALFAIVEAAFYSAYLALVVKAVREHDGDPERRTGAAPPPEAASSVPPWPGREA